MKTIRRYHLLAASLATAIAAWAYNVTGVVADTNGEPLIDATVRLLNAKDSTFVKGAIADASGKFNLKDVKTGRYIIETSYIGYNTTHTPLRVEKANVAVDTIRVGESSVMLKETTVVGVKTPIKVMQDTIEYNADTYKTQPNAVVEDLLKRLPGVEVGTDGKITANGKEIKKILVDGKEFFSDDPKVASKNLPVNMVDKLQVVDRKSDMARITGVDDGEDETVINLTVKKGMKNGWFGTVEGGYGTDDRYQGTFNINRFWNDNQITFIGSANNTNDLGFTDGNGNRFRRFGGDRGINESQSFGVNFNVGKEEIFRVGGDVMYSHTDKHTTMRQDRQYLFPDSTSLQLSNSDTRDRGHNVRADFRIEWKPDSFNTFDFRPNFSYNVNNSTSVSADQLFAGRRGQPNLRPDLSNPVTRSRNTDSSDGTSFEAEGRLIYNHNFKQRKGRSFSVAGSYSLSNVREDDYDFSFNRFSRIKFQDLVDYLDRDSLSTYEQYTDNHRWNNSVGGRLSWTEPLGDASKGHFITAAARANYRWNNSDKLVHRADPLYDLMNPEVLYSGDNFLFPEYYQFGEMQYVDSISNRFRNNFLSMEGSIGFKKVTKAYTLDLGLALTPSMNKSINLTNSAKDIPERWVLNFAPYLRLRYKFSKQKSLQAHYRGRSSQPSITQLQPVADVSNPLNIVQGNPNLAPSFGHSLNLRFQNFDMENQRSVMFMLDGGMTQNAIISKTTFNATTGGRYTTYENVNGVWNARAMNMFSQPLGGSKKWTFNNHIFVNLNHNVGYNNGNRNNSLSMMIAESPAIAFRPDNLELELRPLWNMQATYNSLPNIKTSTIHNYGGSFNGTYYTPIGIVLSTDLTYTAATGYSAGYNINKWMWNGSIAYQFLKGKEATVALRGYDLLGQQKSIFRNVTANYIDDTEYNSLTRYFMVTFTYKFNSFGKGNQPEGRDTWGDGPGGGHRGPGGPPPGMRH